MKKEYDFRGGKRGPVLSVAKGKTRLLSGSTRTSSSGFGSKSTQPAVGTIKA